MWHLGMWPVGLVGWVEVRDLGGLCKEPPLCVQAFGRQQPEKTGGAGAAASLSNWDRLTHLMCDNSGSSFLEVLWKGYCLCCQEGELSACTDIKVRAQDPWDELMRGAVQLESIQ